MKLFKSRINSSNYIKESEEHFIENVKDMILANSGMLFDMERDLFSKGLSLEKILKKNSINTITITIKIPNSYSSDAQSKFSFDKSVSLEDVLSLCELIAKLEYDNKYQKSLGAVSFISSNSINFNDEYIGDYAEKINNLLIHDLDGRYIIERVGDVFDSTLELIEKEGSLKIKESVLDDDIKKSLFKYYNPATTFVEKKNILKIISNKVEEKKRDISNDNDDLYTRNINKSIDIFMDIVNGIKDIRHNKKNSISYDEKKELQLMNIAINNALLILGS